MLCRALGKGANTAAWQHPGARKAGVAGGGGGGEGMVTEHFLPFPLLVSHLTLQKGGPERLGEIYPIGKYLEEVCTVLMLLSNFFRLCLVDFK